MSILDIKNLSVQYYRENKTIHALRNVSVAVEEGKTLAVVGESGCGKSTLAFSILGLIFPHEGKITSGSISYDGKDLLSLPQEELENIRGNKVSIIFQDPYSSLNPVLSVNEQLTEIIDAHRAGLTRDEKAKLVTDALDEVMLHDHERILQSYPHNLSGGQRQRVCIAMAIINKPKLLIADEPTTALDVTIQKEIMELIGKLKEELSLTVILITHNLPLASRYSDRIAVMYAGDIVEEGTSFDVFTKPLHPYTQGLLLSVPKLLDPSALRYTLSGQPPDLSNLPAGCKFWPRCPKVMDVCRQKEPQEFKVNNAVTKCFLYGGNK